MATPARVKKWDAENPERTNARKLAYRHRQKAERDAIRTATHTEETTTK